MADHARAATDPCDRLTSIEDELRALEGDLRGGVEAVAAAELERSAELVRATVAAGPFGRPEELEAFRGWLAAAPGARDVYVRAFEAGHATFEVRLGDG
jgi:hypothetical protein